MAIFKMKSNSSNTVKYVLNMIMLLIAKLILLLSNVEIAVYIFVLIGWKIIVLLHITLL
jgi:hypothetical protein